VKATAIIVAAGEGRRVGAGISKVYLPIGGRAVLLRTLDQFFRAKRVDDVIVVIAKQDLVRCRSLLDSDPQAREQSWIVQAGGSSRQESVNRGLEKVSSDCDVVVIHDGARPFVSPELIDRVVETASARNAVVVGLGKPVYMIDGERTNIKITLPEDLLFAEALVASGRSTK
jgi:2-C-methyl-D-erythritol 4-phosphate cytidylyltransferase